jgi:NAD+--asparagine ADP-ribosyltransferase
METPQKINRASKSFITAGVEFENIERILLYFKVSNNLINEDILKSIAKLKTFNESLEIPYDLDPKLEREFLEINYYEKTLSTMMYVKTIDNFENYFKEILSEIVISDPRVLKSKETEQLDFILSFTNYQSLVNAIAEKKIEALFYQGIVGIQKFFHARTGVEVFKEKSEQINLLVKQRNLAVHNRSKISKEFIRQFPNENFEEAMYLNFTFDYVEKIVPALYKIINELDYEFTKKFNINQVDY